MKDPVLKSRLIALTQQLARVGDPVKILTNLKLQKDELENLSLLDEIRDGLATLIFGKVQPLQERLLEIRDVSRRSETHPAGDRAGLASVPQGQPGEPGDLSGMCGVDRWIGLPRQGD